MSNMFSARLTRAAHRVATAANSASAPTATSPSSSACQSFATVTSGRAHQRRPSSSKASCPPDSTAGGKPAPGAKANVGTDAESTTSATSNKSFPKISKGRSRASGPRKSHSQLTNKSGTEAVDQFADLPSVPSIQNWSASDLGLSSFFSLHRPLSLTNPIPPPSTLESFGSIFSRSQQDAWQNGNTAEGRPEDIIITLQHTIDSLEGSGQQDGDNGVRWEVVLANDSNTVHLDGLPRLKSLDELVASFRPFRSPPPPEPFKDTKAGPRRRKSKKLGQLAQSRPSPAETEATSAETQLIDTQEPQTEVAVRDPSPIRQPFLERMRRRQQAYLVKQLSRPQAVVVSTRRMPGSIRRERVKGQLGKMQLISVKRQRKLKMKKHKYKKLMKRTRNLRRRLDRA